MGATEEMIRKTLDQIKEQQKLEKAITLSTGLVGYDLEQPAKNLYPVLSPIRNMLPRTKAAKGSTAVNWKAITGLSATGSAFVGEGARNGEISYTESDLSAAYKTWGRDDSVTREAEQGAQGFEDLRARSARSLLQYVMIEEEDLLVGALSSSHALGTSPTPTISSANTGGTIGAGTYDVICVVLPFLGYRKATVNAVNAAAHAAQSVASATTTITGTGVISGHVTPVNGAAAYAWFIGTAGNEKCELITTVANFKVTALAGTGQAATAVTGNTSGDTNAFDGIIPQIVNGNGHITQLANGTDGTGTGLTYDNAGGIVEFDAELKYQWDVNRLSPDIIFVNSQEAMNISTKILKSSNNPVYQFIVPQGDAQGELMGSALVTRYLNKFTGTPVKIQSHPTLTPGTVVFYTQNLPAWYVNTNVEGLWDVHVLEDYYELQYAMTTRKWEHGIYARGVLRGYLPAGCSMIQNISNA